jgi:hypothetical protein
VEYLPALSSNPSATKKKKNENRRGIIWEEEEDQWGRGGKEKVIGR